MNRSNSIFFYSIPSHFNDSIIKISILILVIDQKYFFLDPMK